MRTFVADRLEEVVGRGQSAMVYRAVTKRTGEVVAVKCYVGGQSGQDEAEAEVSVYRKIEGRHGRGRR